MNVGPITGDGNTVNSNNTTTTVVTQQRGIGFFSAFFLFVIVGGLIVKFWVPILFGALVAAAVWAHWVHYRDARAAKAALVARADAQHAAVLRGDTAGVYGQYPPAAVS